MSHQGWVCSVSKADITAGGTKEESVNSVNSESLETFWVCFVSIVEEGQRKEELEE